MSGYSYDSNEGQSEGCLYVQFKGPGLSRFEPSVIIRKGKEQTFYHVEKVSRMLARAFEAGRQAKAAEIREVLGVPGR